MAHLVILGGLAVFAGSFGAKSLIRMVRNNKMRSAGWVNDPKVVEKYKCAFEDPMSRREAALILGVTTGANEAEVQQAYKVMISLNHPDKGGSSYMAMKIIQAKDIMLVK